MILKDLAAIALQMSSGGQANKMDCACFAGGREGFLLNADHTILARFEGLTDAPAAEVRWKSGDWFGDSISTTGDTTVFRGRSGGCAKTVTCAAPKETLSEIKRSWSQLWPPAAPSAHVTLLWRQLKDNLDEDITHVEFYAANGKTCIRQRDIYGGRIVNIELPGGGLAGGFFGATSQTFKTTSIRTKDLIGLFLTVDELRFSFGEQTTLVSGNGIQAIVGNCIYDELYQVAEVSHGR